MGSTWSWRNLFNDGDTAITAARRIGVGPGSAGTPTTATDWEEIRLRLYQRAVHRGYSREQITEMDFANMARQLVRDCESERAAYKQQGGRK